MILFRPQRILSGVVPAPQRLPHAVMMMNNHAGHDYNDPQPQQLQYDDDDDDNYDHHHYLQSSASYHNHDAAANHLTPPADRPSHRISVQLAPLLSSEQQQPRQPGGADLDHRQSRASIVINPWYHQHRDNPTTTTARQEQLQQQQQQQSHPITVGQWAHNCIAQNAAVWLQPLIRRATQPHLTAMVTGAATAAEADTTAITATTTTVAPMDHDHAVCGTCCLTFGDGYEIYVVVQQSQQPLQHQQAQSEEHHDEEGEEEEQLYLQSEQFRRATRIGIKVVIRWELHNSSNNDNIDMDQLILSRNSGHALPEENIWDHVSETIMSSVLPHHPMGGGTCWAFLVADRFPYPIDYRNNKHQRPKSVIYVQSQTTTTTMSAQEPLWIMQSIRPLLDRKLSVRHHDPHPSQDEEATLQQNIEQVELLSGANNSDDDSSYRASEDGDTNNHSSSGSDADLMDADDAEFDGDEPPTEASHDEPSQQQKEEHELHGDHLIVADTDAPSSAMVRANKKDSSSTNAKRESGADVDGFDAAVAASRQQQKKRVKKEYSSSKPAAKVKNNDKAKTNAKNHDTIAETAKTIGEEAQMKKEKKGQGHIPKSQVDEMDDSESHQQEPDALLPLPEPAKVINTKKRPTETNIMATARKRSKSFDGSTKAKSSVSEAPSAADTSKPKNQHKHVDMKKPSSQSVRGWIDQNLSQAEQNILRAAFNKKGPRNSSIRIDPADDVASGAASTQVALQNRTEMATSKVTKATKSSHDDPTPAPSHENDTAVKRNDNNKKKLGRPSIKLIKNDGTATEAAAVARHDDGDDDDDSDDESALDTKTQSSPREKRNASRHHKRSAVPESSSSVKVSKPQHPSKRATATATSSSKSKAKK